MSTKAIHKIKGLIVAASENLQEGHRDVASHLMEIALDEMEAVSPEDIDILLEVVDDAVVDPDATVEEDPDDMSGEVVATVDTAKEHNHLYDIVKRMKVGNA